MRAAWVLVVLAGCGVEAVPHGDDEPAPDAWPSPPDEDRTVTIELTDLQPGWRVTTSRFTTDEAPREELTISDGTPITLTAGPDDVVVVAATDAAGALQETQAMYAHCSTSPAHQLEVPAEYPTIQAAVDDAKPGDTVKVAPGTYHEAVEMHDRVCLMGSGAHQTVLDAEGLGYTLIDLSKAPGSMVTGFRLTGTTMRSGCAQPQSPWVCGGDWYTAAIYLGGQAWNDPAQHAPPIIANNLIDGNEYGVFLYWRTLAIIRNNVFVGNRFGVVANHFQGRSFIANNVFVDNTDHAIVNQAAYLDIQDNVIVGSDVAIGFEYVQTGWIRCNVFHDNGENARERYGWDPETPRFTIGEDGNVDADPMFMGPTDFHLQPGSPAHDAGCHGPSVVEPDGTPPDIGAFGGPLAAWVSL